MDTNSTCTTTHSLGQLVSLPLVYVPVIRRQHPVGKQTLATEISDASFAARVSSLGALISSVVCFAWMYTKWAWELALFQSHSPPDLSWKVRLGLRRCSGPDLSSNALPNNIRLLWGVYIYQITLRLSNSGRGSGKGL